MEVSEKPVEAPNLLHCLKIFAATQTPAEVLLAMQSYLSSWSGERIANLQRVAGGWAPFDRSLRPLQINGVRDLRRIRDAVNRQCEGLRQIELTPTPELMELSEILFIATEMAESLMSPEFKARSAASAARTGLLNLL